jgi:integrase
MATELKFTKTAIEKLPLPDSGRVAYLDTDPPKASRRDSIKGLRLMVSHTGVKSFVLSRKFQGRLKNFTIGRFPSWTVDMARKEALQLMASMNRGVDPIKERRAAKTRGITIKEAFDDYLDTRGSQLKESTKKNYRMMIKSHLSDWQTKSMVDVTGEMVQRKHAALTKKSPTAANSTMKVLRAVYRFGQSKYIDEHGKPLLPYNPVDQLTQMRLWNKESRRQRKIQNADLETWFATLNELYKSNQEYPDVAADYFRFLILTGFRRREASGLRIEDVDFRERSFTIHDTKNTKSLTLPMSDQLELILKRRCKDRIGGYAFVGPTSEGNLDDPRKQLDFVREESGLTFTPHDLRRTFVSVAESLDISAYALKTLVNHSTGSDVTAGYVIMDVERLREPMQRITDHLLHRGTQDSVAREGAKS